MALGFGIVKVEAKQSLKVEKEKENLLRLDYEAKASWMNW